MMQHIPVQLFHIVSEGIVVIDGPERQYDVAGCAISIVSFNKLDKVSILPNYPHSQTDFQQGSPAHKIP